MSSAIAHIEDQAGFEPFSLDRRINNALVDAGYRTPRAIQTETIPACLDGRDVMGLAQTGTGKTAAFAIPILQRMLETRGKGTRALILAPTRELANQIATEIDVLAKRTKITTMTVYGGTPMRSQIRRLRQRPPIVVGCPGRVLDLLQQGVFDVSQIETLVLDEADHMFDMGFLRDLRKILAKLPSQRQNLLFSATMPKEIRSLADDLLDDPHVVELARSTPSGQIEHFLYPMDEGKKVEVLDRVLGYDDCKTAIVFTRTKHRAKRTADRLAKRGLRAVALQGNMSQAQRDRAMAGFRKGRFDVLVATDIAARGLDVAGVDYVVNFDVPNTSEAYTHRIGRTGRSEESGKACTFATTSDRSWLRATEKALGQPIDKRPAPDDLGLPVDCFDKPGRSRAPRGNGGNARNQGNGSGGQGAKGQRPRKRARRRTGPSRRGNSAAR